MLQQEQDIYPDYANLPEDEIETRYIYIYEEDPEPHHWHWPKLDGSRVGNLCMQLLTIAMLAGFCVVQGQPAYQIQTIKVPALLLPVLHLSASARIIATGVETIPATRASGTLTIYNGSTFQESLPAGFIVTSNNGVEIETDQAVTIPAANLPEPGIATVAAHALLAGSQGNIVAQSINQVDGGSIVLKNLAPFTGGRDASTIHVVQDTDREAATAEAKARAEAKRPTARLLAKPCTETVKQLETQVTVLLDCQFVTYRAPANVQILSVLQIQGSSVVLRVRKVVLPQ